MTESLKIPSESVVSSFIRKWKLNNPALFERLRNPDGYRSKFRVSLGNAAEGITRVGQRFEIDGPPADILCLDGRFHLNTIIDVYSRRMVALLTRTASVEATAALLRKALPILGKPEEIGHDWGHEYVNGRIYRASHWLGSE